MKDSKTRISACQEESKNLADWIAKRSSCVYPSLSSKWLRHEPKRSNGYSASGSAQWFSKFCFATALNKIIPTFQIGDGFRYPFCSLSIALDDNFIIFLLTHVQVFPSTLRCFGMSALDVDACHIAVDAIYKHLVNNFGRFEARKCGLMYHREAMGFVLVSACVQFSVDVKTGSPQKARTAILEFISPSGTDVTQQESAADLAQKVLRSTCAQLTRRKPSKSEYRDITS